MKKILIIILPLLLFSSHSYAGKWQTNMKKQEKKDFANYVLRNQSKNKMVFNSRNVPNRPGLIKFFDKIEDDMGVAEKGIEFNLSYSDEGDKLDWSRWGKPGFAQRFQIQEPNKHATKKGKTKWYRVGYFIPKKFDTFKHNISLFDFKMIYGKGEKAVGPSFNINNNNIVWIFNGPNYKVAANESGEQYNFDGYVVHLDDKFSPLRGKWVNLLINAKWAKDGFLHFWIDGRLRSSYFGNVLGGASRVRFKFGPYRNYMTDATDQGLEIKDAVIRYSNIGKADKCDDLWSGCDEIINQLNNNSQVHGAISVNMCIPSGDTDKPASCNNLGYPQNPRPF
ncbi:polysaccharide lyase [Candidatus Pelagibacter sp.]|nr:polysaccharide lyase [Candidatus Pelagibacter sp.]